MDYSILENFEYFKLKPEERKVICLDMNFKATKIMDNHLPSVIPCNGIQCGSLECFNILTERQKYIGEK